MYDITNDNLMVWYNYENQHKISRRMIYNVDIVFTVYAVLKHKNSIFSPTQFL